MKKEIIRRLEIELKMARLKEELAEKEYEEARDSKDVVKHAMKYAEYQKAQGYTNGILESLDIVRGFKEE